MKIPTSFKLFGQKISVVFEKSLNGQFGNAGEARYTENKIALMPDIEGVHNRPDDYQEQVFCHELTHHILNQMCERDLNNNEKFVDIFGSLLHQALSTAEYAEGAYPASLPIDRDRKLFSSHSFGIGAAPPTLDEMCQEKPKTLDGDTLNTLTDGVVAETNHIYFPDTGSITMEKAVNLLNERIRNYLGWDARNKYQGGRG